MIEEISKLDLSGFFIGEVRDNVDQDMEGKITVYIPQLMHEHTYNEKPYEEEFNVPLDENLILNAKDFKDSTLELEESNYIIARPLVYYEDNNPNWKFEQKFHNAGSLRVPRIGNNVIVIFLDSDLQKCYYLPFSPTVKGDKIDSFNCINPGNYSIPETRSNIDVIRFYWDGTRIEVDTNEHTVKIALPNGNYIKLLSEPEPKCEINFPTTHILGKLIVEKEATFKKTVDIYKLTTCHSDLEVLGTGYFHDDIVVDGYIYNKGINITKHTHSSECGGTSGPI